jgi:rare lipoprotein A
MGGRSTTLPLPRHRGRCVVLCNSFMRKTLALAALSLLALSPVPALASWSGCGQASHYGVGDGYGGRTMANGRPMDPYRMTTAHPSIPLGSVLLVTNRRTGNSVRVKVTDRGPYYGGRILDLSYGAFARISNPSRGHESVCYTRLS